jgi:hypothetical protein
MVVIALSVLVDCLAGGPTTVLAGIVVADWGMPVLWLACTLLAIGARVVISRIEITMAVMLRTQISFGKVSDRALTPQHWGWPWHDAV